MDWRYIAGFFDGEGTLTKVEKRYRIYITQTNFGVLDAIRRFTGVGNVRPIKKRQPHWQDAWVYYIADKHRIRSFLDGVKPYLIVKKRLALAALDAVDVKIKNEQERISLKHSRIKVIAQRRDQGLSYRAIGKELGIDWGYARKLIKGLR